MFILFLGIVAALNQVGVATTVTTPVLITILATVGGVIVVGVGGGLIRPMQQRWEGYLSTAEREAPRIKQQAADAPSAKEQGRGDPARGSDQRHPGSRDLRQHGATTATDPRPRVTRMAPVAPTESESLHHPFHLKESTT